MTFVNDHQEAGDKIALSDWSTVAFTFYDRYFHLDRLTMVKPISTENNSDEFLKDLCSTEQSGRIWIVFSHRFDERYPFLTQISAIAPLLMKWESSGSGSLFI